MNTRLIDVHTHVVPARLPDNPLPERERRWPCMQRTTQEQALLTIDGKPFRALDERSWSVPRRCDDMDAWHVARQVLSPMPELLSYWFEPMAAVEMCHSVNETIATMVATAPARFLGLGMIPMQDPALAVDGLRRLKRDGFVGVEIGSNVGGVLLGDGRFEDVFAAAAELDLAVFVHPLHPVGADRLVDMPELVPFSAFPLDTALTAMSLIRSGIPARLPHLKLGFSHGGGAIEPLVHRLTRGWELSDGFGGRVPMPPIEYARRFFYDNLVYDAGYFAHLANEFAPGQVFCGTDYPYVIMEGDPAGFIARSAILDRTAVESGAAERFLGLSQ